MPSVSSLYGVVLLAHSVATFREVANEALHFHLGDIKYRRIDNRFSIFIKGVELSGWTGKRAGRLPLLCT